MYRFGDIKITIIQVANGHPYNLFHAIFAPVMKLNA